MSSEWLALNGEPDSTFKIQLGELTWNDVYCKIKKDRQRKTDSSFIVRLRLTYAT